MSWFREYIYPDFAQMVRYDELLHRRVSSHQTIEVYRTRRFGRVLVIDGAIQLTQADNHIYHEMLVHVPLLAHGCAADVLVIGGGDGGTLRELVKHPVKRVTLIEIDPEVADVSMRYFPEVSDGAFHDPRVTTVFEDAAIYVERRERHVDVIIIDSTDPTGPGGSLFAPSFYAACRRLLRPDGVIVLQAGAAVSSDTASREASAAFEVAFGPAEEYVIPVPSYPMGMLTLRGKGVGGWSLSTDFGTLERRYNQSMIKTHHYSPAAHKAAFEFFPKSSRERCKDLALASALAAAIV